MISYLSTCGIPAAHLEASFLFRERIDKAILITRDAENDAGASKRVTVDIADVY